LFYNVAMKVGIRELKQHASAVIRRAASGESVEVTDRGRTVARIVPAEASNPYDRMVADGELIVGNGRWADLEPLPSLPGRTLSDALAELRADER
jgi:prevent-host-death family protein